MTVRVLAFAAVFATCFGFDLYRGWVSLAALYPDDSAALIELDPSGFARLFLLGIALVLAGALSVAGHVTVLRYLREKSGGVRLAWALRSAFSGFMAFLLARLILQLSADAIRSLGLPAAAALGIGVCGFIFAAALSTIAVERLTNLVSTAPAGVTNR